jgi:hypothetical protein
LILIIKNTILKLANHNKDHSVMIYTCLDVFGAFFILPKTAAI